MSEKPIVLCPHCNSEIIIEEVNCKIFRHGVYKATGEQMHPHAPKDECDKAVTEDTIYGCGKPFCIEYIDEKWIAILCDYI
jgi:hypothetical protein